MNSRWQSIEQNAGKLVVTAKVFHGIKAGEMEKICELGRGNYGLVNKCRFRKNYLAIKVLKNLNYFCIILANSNKQ